MTAEAAEAAGPVDLTRARQAVAIFGGVYAAAWLHRIVLRDLLHLRTGLWMLLTLAALMVLGGVLGFRGALEGEAPTRDEAKCSVVRWGFVGTIVAIVPWLLLDWEWRVFGAGLCGALGFAWTVWMFRQVRARGVVGDPDLPARVADQRR